MRERFGTEAARDLRRKGMVRAVVYGAGKELLSIYIEEKEITKHYKKSDLNQELFKLKWVAKRIKFYQKL